MPALCSMLLGTYYAPNYAGIIGTGLPRNSLFSRVMDNAALQSLFNKLSSGTTEDQSLIIQKEADKFLEKGEVKMVHKITGLVYSPFFVVPKSGGGYRPILDLRYIINSYLEPHEICANLHVWFEYSQ